jgi:hypothetical protein
MPMIATERWKFRKEGGNKKTGFFLNPQNLDKRPKDKTRKKKTTRNTTFTGQAD